MKPTTVSPKALVRRVPFAIALTLAIILAGLWSGSWAHPIDPAFIARWGFGFPDFADGHIWSLFTQVFFTDRPFMFWGIVPFAAIVIGTYEWTFGSRRALIVFWVGNLLGSLIISGCLVGGLYAAGAEIGARWALSHDVGISGGGFAVLGAYVYQMHPRWLWTG